MNLRKSFQLQVEQLESRDAPAVLWSMNIGKGKSPVTLQLTDTGLYQFGSGKHFTVVQPTDARVTTALRSAGLTLASMPNLSTTSLTSTGPSIYGDAVSFTATVKAKNNGAVKGTVQFFIDGVAFGAPVAVVNGTATSGPISTLSAGSHKITATFTSSQPKVLSSSACLTQTVAQRSITVTADAQSKTYGQSDPDLTYAITGGSLVSGDSFSGALSREAGENAGSYAIVQDSLSLSANYFLNFIGSALTINAAVTTTSLEVTPSSVNVGDPVTFTATVSGGATGSVQFVVDGVNFGAPVALVGDTAFLTTTTLGAGSHTVSAVFVPDNGNFAGSVSGEASVNVQESASQGSTITAISGVVGDTGAVGESILFRIVGPDAPVGVGPFIYIVFWGDGTTDTLFGVPQVVELDHTYQFAGSYSPLVRVSDLGSGVPSDIFYDGALTIV